MGEALQARLIVVTVAEPLLVSATATTYDISWATRPPRSSRSPARAGTVDRRRAARPERLPQDAPGIDDRENPAPTTVPVLVAPPPEQTPPATIAPRIEVSCVLAPVDFKDDSVTDVRAAGALVRSLGVPLLLVHVVAPLKGLERLRPQLDTHNPIQIERAEQQIQRFASQVGRPASIETVIGVGSPAEEITRIAVERRAGLIVMGLRNQEHLFGPRPGSVAYRVLSLAPARVLALPPGLTDAEWLRAPVASQS